jgi:hypothetical protein
MIPLNALNGLDVFPGSNPIFGLGTLGGALSMRTKSGFDSTEGNVEALGGSFNRKQFQGSIGGNNGVVAGFAAANIFREDGWRDNSPSEVNQFFTKGEWRNEKLQLGLSALYAGTDLVGNGMLPTEIAKHDPSRVFTSPDQTKNKLLQFQLTGLWDVSDTFNVAGQIYRRKSQRKSSTSDINQDFAGYATRRPAPSEQVIPGYADINNDGLPDYNSIPFNIAADANGFVLDTNGNPQFTGYDGNGIEIPNPAYNGTALVGTDFNTLAHPNQAMTVGADGVTPIPSWTLIAAFLVHHETNMRALDAVTDERAELQDEQSGIEDISLRSISEDTSPVVKFVRSTLHDALKAGASDIHMETDPHGLTVKYRIDGVLSQEGGIQGIAQAEQAISRIKVMSELDIAERRVPQDGRFKVLVQGREVDMRVGDTCASSTWIL